MGGNQGDELVESSGAVYVFRRAGTGWQKEAYVKASNTGYHDLFGTGDALSGDTLAVAAHEEDSAATGHRWRPGRRRGRQQRRGLRVRRTGVA